MFQPQSYQEKRNVMNEMLLQQLTGLLRSLAPPTAQQQLNVFLENYGLGMQHLRDAEAARVLGPIVKEEGVKYAGQGEILEYLKANLGRTYFGTSEKTAAPDGSIGTAGFGKKFGDWLAGLPSYDTSLSKDIVSGFYRDDMTERNNPLPMLVIRHGNEVTVILFRQYVSIMTLNLDHVPEAYNWESPNHYMLRGEMYTYRGGLTDIQFQTHFAAALADQGITALHEPKLAEVTTGYAQVVEEAKVDESVDVVADAPAAETTPAE